MYTIAFMIVLHVYRLNENYSLSPIHVYPRHIIIIIIITITVIIINCVQVFHTKMPVFRSTYVVVYNCRDWSIDFHTEFTI